MRSALNALRPFAVKAAEEAREKIAAELFKLDAVKLAITEAALRGESSIRLPLGSHAVELRGTVEAGKLAAWVEANGLKMEWRDRVAERSNGLKVEVSEPVIWWGEERHK
jgi:hypothetical protein